MDSERDGGEGERESQREKEDFRGLGGLRRERVGATGQKECGLISGQVWPRPGVQYRDVDQKLSVTRVCYCSLSLSLLLLLLSLPPSLSPQLTQDNVDKIESFTKVAQRQGTCEEQLSVSRSHGRTLPSKRLLGP